MPDKICENSKCAACFACQNVCPAGAVELKPNAYGEVFPVINEKCTECGLCVKTCPANGKAELHEPKKAYAFYSKNADIRSNSASGGLIYSVASKFDGVVYGAAFTEGLNVEHVRIEDKDGLTKIQGSKYVHSHINSAYKSAKADLEAGRKVLFTGTPCQIAGLKAYLGNDCPTLYTIDLVCHGVPERETLKDYANSEFDVKNGDEIRFRDEKGWNMTLRRNGEVKGEMPFKQNYYYHGFLEGWTYRENCYSCPYAKSERCGDLTACDFWGVTDEGLKAELKKGLNAALINTEKGAELFDSIKEAAEYAEREVSEVVSGNGQLRHPTPETKYSKRFQKLSKKHGAVYALKNTRPKKRIIFTLRKIKNAGNSNN